MNDPLKPNIYVLSNEPYRQVPPKLAPVQDHLVDLSQGKVNSS